MVHEGLDGQGASSWHAGWSANGWATPSTPTLRPRSRWPRSRRTSKNDDRSTVARHELEDDQDRRSGRRVRAITCRRPPRAACMASVVRDTSGDGSGRGQLRTLRHRSSDWCAERGPPWAAFPKPTGSYSPTNPSGPSATMAAKPVRRRSSRSAQPCAPSGAAGSWPSCTAARSTPATHRSSWRSRASTASSSAVPRGRSRAT